MGGIAFGLSDLPMGNQKAKIKNHNADKGCRCCEVESNHLGDLENVNPRFHHSIVEERENIENFERKSQKSSQSQLTGVKMEKSPFEKHLQFDLGKNIFPFFLFPFSSLQTCQLKLNQ